MKNQIVNLSNNVEYKSFLGVFNTTNVRHGSRRRDVGGRRDFNFRLATLSSTEV